MMKVKILLSILILLVLFGCKGKVNKDDFILNGLNHEWRLEKFNEKSNMINFNRLYIVFHDDGTYEIYHKEKGQRVFSTSDNIIEHKWYFDNFNNLYISTFPNLKLIKLDKNKLEFKFRKEKYAFVCEDC